MRKAVVVLILLAVLGTGVLVTQAYMNGPRRNEVLRVSGEGIPPIHVQMSSFRYNAIDHCFEILLTNSSNQFLGDCRLAVGGPVRDGPDYVFVQGDPSAQPARFDLHPGVPRSIVFDGTDTPNWLMDPQRNHFPLGTLPGMVYLITPSRRFAWEVVRR